MKWSTAYYRYRAALQSIADGCVNPQALAIEALRDNRKREPKHHREAVQPCPQISSVRR